MSSEPISKFILPPPALASCIAGCIVRDTRDADLSDQDRLNYFPASPLFSATLAQFGEIHLGPSITNVDALRRSPAQTRWFFQGPSDTPQTSWSPGPILGVTIAFYPDAWFALGGTETGGPPDCIAAPLAVLETGDFDDAWPVFWTAMSRVWADQRTSTAPSDWAGSPRIKDWAHHIFAKLAQSKNGHSLRSAQRRLLRWTGQNRTSIEFYIKVEEAHRLSLSEPNATPAEIATDIGYSDQSHMGRAMKRATGFSPMDLNKRIAEEEPFWCYRLLGERF